MTPAPALQLQFPFITNRNSPPPSILRKFRSAIGDDEPKKVCDKFQFSFRASTKNDATRSARPSIGVSTEANTRRFSESHRTREEKFTARPPKLNHSGYTV